MAYPEPIPEIKDRDSKKFLKRLDEFELSDAQRRYYREAFEAFERSERKRRR